MADSKQTIKDKGSITIKSENMNLLKGVSVNVTAQLNLQLDLSLKGVCVVGFDSALKLAVTATVKFGLTMAVGACAYKMHTHSGAVSFLSAKQTVEDIKAAGTSLDATLKDMKKCCTAMTSISTLTTAVDKAETVCARSDEFVASRRIMAEQLTEKMTVCEQASQTANHTVQKLKENLKLLTQTMAEYVQTAGKESEQAKSISVIAGKITDMAGQIVIN